MARPASNFFFFSARATDVYNGVRASEVADPYQQRKGLVPSLVVGPQLLMRTDKIVKWATVIPPGLNDIPEFHQPRGGDHTKIIRGAIEQKEVEGKKENFLVSYRDENAYYVLVRSGLQRVNGSIMQDRLNIQKDGELMTHGAYSFDTGSVRIATADHEQTLKDAFADPNIAFGRVAAERMDVQVVGKAFRLVGGIMCSQTSYVLWRMPFGAVLLVRDVNGKLTRLVSEPSCLRPVDASGYAKFFDILEEEYRRHQAALITPAVAASA